MNMKAEILRTSDFESFFKVMEEAFPSIERRTFDEQKKLLSEDKYKILGYKDEKNKVLAFIALWEFEEFIFIEHFAVDSKMRGKGIGTDLINKCLNEYHKNVVLEVELPEDELSIRRIEYYKRMNFILNEHQYFQPPLQKDFPLLPLKIMSYGKEVAGEEFENIKNKIYKYVYKYN